MIKRRFIWGFAILFGLAVIANVSWSRFGKPIGDQVVHFEPAIKHCDQIGALKYCVYTARAGTTGTDTFSVTARLGAETASRTFVVKIADEVEVDVSTQAWKVRYPDAVASAQEVEIDGVRIPFVSIETLIASKETYREIDQWDAAQLRLLASQKKTGGK